MKAVYRHELSSQFTSLSACVFIAFLLLFAGIYTMAINIRSGIASFEYVLSNMSFTFMIIVPVLTMRSIAEEKRQKQITCCIPYRSAWQMLSLENTLPC